MAGLSSQSMQDQEILLHQLKMVLQMVSAALIFDDEEDDESRIEL